MELQIKSLKREEDERTVVLFGKPQFSSANAAVYVDFRIVRNYQSGKKMNDRTEEIVSVRELSQRQQAKVRRYAFVLAEEEAKKRDKTIYISSATMHDKKILAGIIEIVNRSHFIFDSEDTPFELP